MYPLVRQVQQATSHPIKAWSALAGTEAQLAEYGDELPGAQGPPRQDHRLRQGLQAGPDRTEDKDMTLKLGANERKFSGQGLLLNHILLNFYFYCTTAYDILRHCGIELGKRDFMGTPMNLA
jgi:hypothetical protein